MSFKPGAGLRGASFRFDAAPKERRQVIERRQLTYETFCFRSVKKGNVP